MIQRVPLFIRQLSLSLFLTLSLLSCSREEGGPELSDFRQPMRDFVITISRKAHTRDTDFIVIPQNGIELLTQNGNANGMIVPAYLDAIDAVGQEELNFGYDNQDNTVTPAEVTTHLESFLGLAQSRNKAILITDYCSEPAKISTSYSLNAGLGFTGFAATHRELDVIPPGTPWGENDRDIFLLSHVKNFLYLLNTRNFETKASFLDAVKKTNFDLLIMDLYSQDGDIFTPGDLETIQMKAGGGRRLLICYLSIGEAENYRYYWDPAWETQKPGWLGQENPDWQGNYQVRYWDPEWQKMIAANTDSYLEKIINAGFDGVYLDRIDAFEDFEELSE